jgi:hypothetical protein
MQSLLRMLIVLRNAAGGMSVTLTPHLELHHCKKKSSAQVCHSSNLKL